MKNRIIIFLFVNFIFVACSSSKDEIPLAKVGNKTLYYSDLMLDLPEDISAKDSTVIVQSEIRQWILSELMLSEANNYLNEQEKDISRQIEEYRKTLLIFEFEKKWVLNHIDTMVTDDEISSFYNSNTYDFELKTNILKLRFVKMEISKSNALKEQVKRLLFSTNSKDLPVLERICNEHAENFFLDDSVWLMYDDVIKEIPFGNVLQKGSTLTSKRFELSDANYEYFVLVKEIKIKDEMSPLAYEKENIKMIILQQRKIFLLDSLQQQIYSSATSAGTYTTYE
ncbi:MAG: hypothetical protein PHI36_00485 [Bacteroidales bacterium]|nr:hypothetical protein [Bacteroidales bacterium]MDD4574882.1 hypothetical protein [Bacteroidales bacterium]